MDIQGSTVRGGRSDRILNLHIVFTSADHVSPQATHRSVCETICAPKPLKTALLTIYSGTDISVSV